MAEKFNLDNDAHADFFREYIAIPVQEMVNQYGEAEVEAALIKKLPGYDPEVTLDEGLNPLALVRLFGRGGKAFGKSKIGRGLTKWGKRAGNLGLGALGFLGRGFGALAGLGGNLAMRNVNQDVTIDGVTTDDAMNVTPKGDILKLITQTNKLLQAITQILGANAKELGDMDDNMDDLIAVQTGMSQAQVKGAQATGTSVGLSDPYPGLAGSGDKKSGSPDSAPEKKEEPKKK